MTQFLHDTPIKRESTCRTKQISLWIWFMDLVLHCEEARHLSGNMFLKQVCSAIEADLHEQMQQVRKLYNPYHNLYLDKCYGESKSPLSEWMDFSKCGE